MADIAERKTDHLDLATSGDVGFKRTTTLLECVKLVHDALPDLDLDAIELGSNVLGKRLRAPILIAAMTGGAARADRRRARLRLWSRQPARHAQAPGSQVELRRASSSAQRAGARQPGHRAGRQDE